MTACAAAGALHTHGSLAAHVRALVDAWAWQQDDRILHALPLHHVHGVINALHCAHAVGAAVEFLPKFSPADVWRCLTVRASRAAYMEWVGALLTVSCWQRLRAEEVACAVSVAAGDSPDLGQLPHNQNV